MNKNSPMRRKIKKFIGRYLLVLPTIVTMLISSVVINPGTARADTANSVLHFDNSTPIVTNGNSFTLTPIIQTGTNSVSIVALRITFDHTKLSLDTPVLPAYHLATPFYNPETDLATAVDNTAGTASFDVSVGTDLGSGGVSVNGTFPIATLTFHAIATGSASVAFTGAAGQSGAAADNVVGNAVINTMPATVTVNDNGCTPGQISTTSPSGTLQSGTTQTTVSITTDVSATCKYSLNTEVPYSSMTNSFTSTGGTTHTFLATGLTNGNSYTYFVNCADTCATTGYSGDIAVSFSVASGSSSSSSSSSSHHHKKKKTSSRKISNSPKSINRGQILIQSGKKFSKNSNVALYFSGPNGTYYKPQIVRTTSTGSFSVSYRVTKPAGTYKWYAVNLATGWKSKILTYTVK